MTTTNPVRTTIRPSIHAIQEALFDQRASYGEQKYPHGTGRGTDRGLADQARTRAHEAAASGNLSWRQLLMLHMAETFAQNDLRRLRAELAYALGIGAAWLEAIDQEMSSGELTEAQQEELQEIFVDHGPHVARETAERMRQAASRGEVPAR